jgi:hypothetical protein
MNKFKTRHLLAALACLVLTLTLTSVGPARAAEPSSTMSAADFAAACNARPGFTLESNTVVTGGSATITSPYGTCWVHLAPGVSLTFERVALNSPKGSLIGLVVDGEDGSEVHVRQSTLDFGGLFLEPGGYEPGRVGGNNGLLEVSQSTLRSTYVTGELRLMASYCADGGKVIVTQSDISAPSVVLVGAGVDSPYHSCYGSNGNVQVTQSTVTGTSPQYGVIHITTGPGGKTSATQNSFSAVSTSVWSNGGSCKSELNIPETPCS